MKKITVACDIDGVLYDWDGCARFMLRNLYTEYGLHHPGALDSKSDRWDAIKDGIDAFAWRWLWKDGIKNGLFKHGNLVKGSLSGLQKLSEMCEVVLVTSRPKAATLDTMGWCYFHLSNVRLAGVNILGEGVPKHSVPFDVLIDDSAANITSLPDSRYGVLFSQPWNKKSVLPAKTPSRHVRCSGWDDIFCALSTLNILHDVKRSVTC